MNEYEGFGARNACRKTYNVSCACRTAFSNSLSGSVNVEIGTGVGAGAGAGLGAIKYDSQKDDYIIYPVMGFLIGAGVGAASGLAFGASRRHRTLIYAVQ